MFPNDYPLLNTPNLVALILRGAEARGAATEQDFVADLAETLEMAHEHPPVPEGEVASRIARLCRHLSRAGLLEADGTGRLRLTQRGVEALRRHPQGFGTDLLMEYPEYAAFRRARAERGAAMDPRLPAYDDGFRACRAGAPLTANPSDPGSVDHLAWENGWFEAQDEQA